MSKTYFWLSFLQGISIALFIIFLPDYINDDSFWNFIKVLIPFNGIIIFNRVLAREDIKQ